MYAIRSYYEWLVHEGDEVHAGDVIAEIETDKATMEVEAVDEGTVGKLLVDEGAEGVPAGSIIPRSNGPLRITSYNVCYTKLLRDPVANMAAISTGSPTKLTHRQNAFLYLLNRYQAARPPTTR